MPDLPTGTVTCLFTDIEGIEGKEAQTVVWRNAPWIFLWSQKWYVATVRNPDGVCITPFEMWDAVYATWKL